jgi:hypothetical protein
MFKRLNRWYDSLKEPWRFGVLALLVSVYSIGLYSHNLIGMTIGALTLLFTCTWGISRIP